MKPEGSLKICPACGKAFVCLYKAGCWCTKYTLSPEKLLWISEKYPDCLCEDCLSMLACYREPKMQ